MMIDAHMLVRKLLERRASSCHCECRSMMSPMGPEALRGRLAASWSSGFLETTAVVLETTAVLGSSQPAPLLLLLVC